MKALLTTDGRVFDGEAPEHRAAIDRLPTEPGTCGVCGEDLVCCIVEEWRGDGFPHPPFRFVCEDHDVWLGDCVDEDVSDVGYTGGLYTAVLRDVADPEWHWLPEHMRAAAVVCGFGCLNAVGFRITPRGDRAWATDGNMMIDIGTIADGEAALDRSGLIRPQFDRAEETRRFRIPESASSPVFETATMAVIADVVPADVSKFPTEMYGETMMVGAVLVEKHYLDFDEATWPGIRWYVTSKTDPVFGMDGRDVRAVIMPMRQP